MPTDINELDVTDAGLKQIFGDRFSDMTALDPQKVVAKNETTTTPKVEKSAQRRTDKPIEEQWQPPKPAPNYMDKLKDSAKWCLLFGGLSCLVFYWQSVDLMAASIAVPTMCVCTALAGWGVGKNAR